MSEELKNRIFKILPDLYFEGGEIVIMENLENELDAVIQVVDCRKHYFPSYKGGSECELIIVVEYNDRYFRFDCLESEPENPKYQSFTEVKKVKKPITNYEPLA